MTNMPPAVDVDLESINVTWLKNNDEDESTAEKEDLLVKAGYKPKVTMTVYPPHEESPELYYIKVQGMGGGVNTNYGPFDEMKPTKKGTNFVRGEDLQKQVLDDKSFKKVAGVQKINIPIQMGVLMDMIKNASTQKKVPEQKKNQKIKNNEKIVANNKNKNSNKKSAPDSDEKQYTIPKKKIQKK